MFPYGTEDRNAYRGYFIVFIFTVPVNLSTKDATKNNTIFIIDLLKQKRKTS